MDDEYVGLVHAVSSVLEKDDGFTLGEYVNVPASLLRSKYVHPFSTVLRYTTCMTDQLTNCKTK